MKTIVIWDSVTADIKFFVVNKDISHLNHCYINSSDNTEELDTEISNLVYDENGNEKIKMLSEFPLNELSSETKIIVTGFLP